MLTRIINSILFALYITLLYGGTGEPENSYASLVTNENACP